MKKIVSSFIAFGLFISIGTSVFAATPPDPDQKYYDLIDKANTNIENHIEQAQTQADTLKAQYLKDVSSYFYGGDYTNLVNQINQANTALANDKDLNKIAVDQEKINELTAQLNEKQAEITSEMNAIQADTQNLDGTFAQTDQKDLNKLQNSLDKVKNKEFEVEQKYEERSDKYVQDLNNLITKLNQDTNNIANEIVKQTSETDINFEQFWVQVQLGNQTVWVDPIRIVGRY